MLQSMERRKFLLLSTFALFVLCVILIVFAANRIEPRYTITDLGTLGGKESVATSLNERGEVVGWAEDSGGVQRPFIWSESGGMIQIPGGETQGHCYINDSGLVVGCFMMGTTPVEAFLWDRENGLTSLDGLPDGCPHIAGINNGGEVAGWVSMQNGAYHGIPFVRTSKGELVFPGVVDGLQCLVFGIDDEGCLVGDRARSLQEPRTAFVWSAKEGYRDLESMEEYTHGSARGMSEGGRVFGSCFKRDIFTSRAVVWAGSGEAIDLGSLGKARNEPRGVNNRGQVVGLAGKKLTVPEKWRSAKAALGIGDYPWAECAVLWEDGEIHDLNDLIPPDSGWDRLGPAWDINDKGQIVGAGEKNGDLHAFLLSPLSE